MTPAAITWTEVFGKAIADWKTEKHFIYKPRKEIKESQWRRNFIVILQCRFQLLSEQKNASVCLEHKIKQLSEDKQDGRRLVNPEGQQEVELHSSAERTGPCKHNTKPVPEPEHSGGAVLL
ncbi:UNVERIFIED_CONTAM: hypothetical protein FKN15_006760 [Acipenser sinensis]